MNKLTFRSFHLLRGELVSGGCVRWLDKFTLSHFHCSSAPNTRSPLHEARCIWRPRACVEVLLIGARQGLDLEVAQGIAGLQAAVLAQLWGHTMLVTIRGQGGSHSHLLSAWSGHWTPRWPPSCRGCWSPPCWCDHCRAGRAGEAARPANKREHLKSETLQMSHWETSDRAQRLVSQVRDLM